MSLLARAPLRQVARRATAAPVRAMSTGSPVPFSYSSKAGFATKVAVYLISGFSLPFVAAYYQLSKSGGAE